MRILLVSKITASIGAFLLFFPTATLFLLHQIWAAIPVHVPMMDRLMIGVMGMAIALLGFIPTMVKYYRDGTTFISVSDMQRRRGR